MLKRICLAAAMPVAGLLMGIVGAVVVLIDGKWASIAFDLPPPPAPGGLGAVDPRL